MDEKLRFVAHLQEREKMAVLCREFDISRKTGYKIFNRYKSSGLEALTDRSRHPYRQGCQLPGRGAGCLESVQGPQAFAVDVVRQKARNTLVTLEEHLPRSPMHSPFSPEAPYAAADFGT